MVKKLTPGKIIIKKDVKSSLSNNVYTVTIYDNCVSCTCPAGGRKTLCKHIIAFVHENMEMIKSENPEFFEKIMKLIESKNEPISKEEHKELEEALIFVNKNIAEKARQNSINFDTEKSDNGEQAKKDVENEECGSFKLFDSDEVRAKINDVADVLLAHKFLKSSKFLLMTGIFFLFAFAPVGVIILAYYYGRKKRCKEIVEDYSLELKEIYKFKLPEEYEKYFTKDEISEIEFNENRGADKFEKDYDITDEWYQSFFKKAKRKNYRILKSDKENKNSIMEDDKGRYCFTSNKGCSCKNFPENDFCEHMIVNAINHGLISSVNGILSKINDEDFQEMLDFIDENMINSPYDIDLIKTGLVSKVSDAERYFENKGILEITNDFSQIVNYFNTIGDVKNQIPDLKEQIKLINPELKLSYMSAAALRNFIIDNEQIFHKYFEKWNIIEFKDDIWLKISEYDEFAEWLKFCNKKYTT